MKKIFSLLIVLMLILCGCNGFEKIKIEKSNWSLSHITETETDITIFCSEKTFPKFPDAKVIDLKISSGEETITITNIATEESWTLKYAKSKTAETNNTDGSVYDVFYENGDKTYKGYASTGISTKSKFDKDYYFTITIGGYSLYFIDTLD